MTSALNAIKPEKKPTMAKKIGFYQCSKEVSKAVISIKKDLVHDWLQYFSTHTSKSHLSDKNQKIMESLIDFIKEAPEDFDFSTKSGTELREALLKFLDTADQNNKSNALYKLLGHYIQLKDSRKPLHEKVNLKKLTETSAPQSKLSGLKISLLNKARKYLSAMGFKTKPVRQSKLNHINKIDCHDN